VPAASAGEVAETVIRAVMQERQRPRREVNAPVR
jgi:hypothetical protein